MSMCLDVGLEIPCDEIRKIASVALWIPAFAGMTRRLLNSLVILDTVIMI